MCGCSKLPGATSTYRSYTNCSWTLEDLSSILSYYESIPLTTRQLRREKYTVQKQIKIFDTTPCKYYKKINSYVISPS